MANTKNVGRVILGLQKQLKTQNDLEALAASLQKSFPDIPVKEHKKRESNAVFLTRHDKAYQEELRVAIALLQKYMLTTQGTGAHISDEQIDNFVKKERLEKALDNIWVLVDHVKTALKTGVEKHPMELSKIDRLVTLAGKDQAPLEQYLKSILDWAASKSTEDKEDEPFYNTFLSIRLTVERALND